MRLSLVVLALAAALPAGWTARERAAASRVNASTLAAHIRFLSDDLLEGRAPASRGSELGMRYIASQYERLGLEPAGDNGGWFQHFDIVGLTSAVTTPITATASGKTLKLHPFDDSIVASGVQQATAAIHGAELVFVGYGITAPEQGWDDYKEDVRGKVVLILNNDPENDPQLFAGKTRLYSGRWDYKYAEAARHGAVGAIIIHTEHSAGYPFQVVQSSWTGQQFELPDHGEPRLQLKMWATEDASRRLVALGAKELDALRQSAETRDFRPVPLGVRITAGLEIKMTRRHTANVLAVVPGSDTNLDDQYVVVSAHHDHLGIREGKGDGDQIYNGALDNASGVAALLALADAMTAVEPRPKRSVLFAAVAAEESGLLGSEYFCAHPLVPPGRIAANLNIDGINIWGKTKDVRAIGLGKSSLDDVLLGVAKAQGRQVQPDDQPDKGAFYRSDQFNFARIGVPAVYLKPGVLHAGHDETWGRALHEKFTHERYHQPSDEIDATWDFAGAVEDVQLMAVTLLRVANGPRLPTWRHGDEFEAARQKALAAAGR